MPQLDKEIFVEYFFCIFLILIQTFSNESISENFLKINVRYFLFYYFKKAKDILNVEKKYIEQNYL